MRLALPLLAVVALLLAGCGSAPATQVVPVQTPLPEREEAVYRVQDKSGKEIGRATFRIEPDGDTARLTQDYSFAAGQTDRSVAVVDRATMHPRTSERVVQDGGKQYRTSESYAPDHVTVTFTDGGPERQRTAAIAETAYDNLESLFLWRTIVLGAGETVSYVNVVVDPRRGTISRALGTVTVSGREEVKLASGAVEAWRVDFASAGVTNHAWYAVDDRRLIKYEIDRGPTLLLESVSR